MTVRILIVDDHAAVRRAIRSLLSERTDFSVCGEAADGDESVRKTQDLRPDLVLMDISMPGMNGLEATRIIRQKFPGTKLFLVSQNDPAIVGGQAEAVGASAWIAKSTLARDLLPAIDKAFARQHAEQPASREPDSSSLAWLTGGGKMGTLIRSMDWSSTPLGPLERWPHSLQTTVSLCLSSNFPINIVWGPGYNQIYNDGYRVIVADKHPEGMGMAFDKCWASAWPAVGKPFERAWAGETSFLENQRMYLTRNGYLEETFFTFSLSPIRDENGVVSGLFHPVTETTPKMLSERRTRALRELAANTGEARSLEAAFAQIVSTLAAHQLDLPFVLLYSLNNNGAEARLVESTGIEPDLRVSPVIIRLAESGDAGSWPLADILASDSNLEVGELRSRFGDFACGPYEEGCNIAVARALNLPGASSPVGIFIAGVSPRLPFNQDYWNHLEQVSTAIITALSNALAYEREKQRAEALAEIDRAKTAFFSNVSHEFRTPLTLMLGPLEELLAKDGADLSSAAKNQLEVVSRNGARLLRLVNTLLDFSRIEAGRAQAVYQETDLAALTADLASVFRSATERAGLQLPIDCPTLSQPVYVDREMWEKIVLNLLSNAFKFTFEGHITVSLREVEDRAELRVEDTGVGIAAEEIPHIFERFHRIENSRSRTHEGSGIGLALVNEIVKLHGGTLRVESAPGQGSAFTVSVPLGKAHLPAERIGGTRSLASTAVGAAAFVEEALRWLPDSEPLEGGHQRPRDEFVPVARPSASGAGFDGGRARVLIADDNADMRQYLVRLLAENYEVEAVADGEAALEAMRKSSPDLALCDIMMPRLDGLGFLKEVRAREELKEIPVIFLSARAGEESRVEGMEAGADDYLVKPFSARELAARVEAHVKMHRLRQQARLAFEEAQDTLELRVKQRTKELDRVQADFRDLSGKLLRLQDEERRRIARELHDSAGQTLTALSIEQAQIARRLSRDLPGLAGQMEEVQDLTAQLTQEIRTTSYLLHPPALDESGLPGALRWFIEGLTARSGLEIVLEVDDALGRLPAEIELAMFRIVQESLTNIHRHSGSKDAVIRIAHNNSAISLEIRDHGKGMSPEKLIEVQSQGAGVGIRGIRERLRQLQGEMNIQSTGAGTVIYASLPSKKLQIPVEESTIGPVAVAGTNS